MAYDEARFKGLMDALDDVKMQGINTLAVAWPEILGDDYEEITENLARIAEAGLLIAIAGRKPE